jgi:hypothetical protein
MGGSKAIGRDEALELIFEKFSDIYAILSIIHSLKSGVYHVGG